MSNQRKSLISDHLFNFPNPVLALSDCSSTSMSEIAETVQALRANIAEKTRSTELTVEYLKRLERILNMAFEPLADALKKDFNRPTFETMMAEYSAILGELSYFIKNCHSMLKEKPHHGIPSSFSTLSIEIEKIPLGTVLIVTPFNYPLMLSLSPLIGAFACGNNVVLKLPGDQLPHFSNVLKKILDNVFDKKHVFVVTGGVKESTELLNDVKFDKILFTGSTRVGKIVQEAAAKTLTPVVLELGGKSPVFVTKSAKSLDTLCKRLLWGKFTNSGQTCVAPDYVLVDESMYENFIETLEIEFNKAYKDIVPESDFSHLINAAAFERLTGYLKSTKGKILLGGSVSEKNNFIQPTVVTNVDWDDSLMKDEIFGPILPIIKYKSLDDAIDKVIAEHDTPLSMYILGNNKEEIAKIKRIRSGSLAINEFLMAAGCHATPFGGLGTSGTGSYHSKWSVDAFTHSRTVMKQPIWAELLLKARYYPYTEGNFFTVSFFAGLPDFPVFSLRSFFVYLLIFVWGGALGFYGKDIYNFASGVFK